MHGHTVRTHTHTHTCIHTHIQYVHTQTHTYVCTCTHTHGHTHTVHTHTYVYTCTYTQADTYTHMGNHCVCFLDHTHQLSTVAGDRAAGGQRPMAMDGRRRRQFTKPRPTESGSKSPTPDSLYDDFFCLTHVCSLC